MKPKFIADDPRFIRMTLCTAERKRSLGVIGRTGFGAVSLRFGADGEDADRVRFGWSLNSTLGEPDGGSPVPAAVASEPDA